MMVNFSLSLSCRKKEGKDIVVCGGKGGRVYKESKSIHKLEKKIYIIRTRKDTECAVEVSE